MIIKIAAKTAMNVTMLIRSALGFSFSLRILRTFLEIKKALTPVTLSTRIIIIKISPIERLVYC